MKINKVTKKVEKIGENASKWIVLGIFSICIIILFMQSIFSTSVIDRQEHVSYLNDTVLINIILLALILGIGVFIKSKGKQILPMPSQKTLNTITIVYILVMLVIVMTLQIIPTADQGSVLQCAQNLLDGDFKEWQIGGYLYNYPNQNGIVLVFAVLRFIFRDITWLLIQILNILALVICAYYCSKTIGVLFKDKKLTSYSYIFLLGFLGMNCYVTFVYGTIFGMTAAAAGIYNIIKYCENRKFSQGIIGVILVGVSFLFKENYLIFILAALLLLLYDGLFKRKWLSFVLFINGILVCLIVNMSISFAIESITETEIGKGIPNKAWVAMGLQEGKRAPGWYNSYNAAVFIHNDYNYETASKIVDKDIKQRLDYFKQNKEYAIDFFGKKIASQWNEGTFQGFWILETRKKAVEWPTIVSEIIYEGSTFNKVVVEICDFFLSFLWLGVILFIALGWKELDVYKLIYVIVFIGGFIFHLFWEAKAQYTVVYVYFMIPYMARGYQLFFAGCMNLLSEKAIRKK